MGGTLSSQFEWADSGLAGGEKDGSGRLRTSLINHDLLHELARVIALICQKHPNEARAEFRRSLQWSTSLRPNHFSSAQAGTWNVSVGRHKSVVTSVATRSDSAPLFQLEPAPPFDGTVFIARVSSLETLNKVLNVSEDTRLKELQKVLEENRDPISLIFGVKNSEGGAALLQVFDEVNQETDPKRREQASKLYKLLLVVNSYDLELMKTVVKHLENGQNLNVHKVAEEIQMLSAFSGRDLKSALVSIDWESDYTFANGCKAPPWRQVYGEIGYVDVKTGEQERLIITASRKGYFLNGGYSADEKGIDKLNYEPASEVFQTLTELLRSNSKQFAVNIDHQEYRYSPNNVSGRWSCKAVVHIWMNNSVKNESDNEIEEHSNAKKRVDSNRRNHPKHKSLGYTMEDRLKAGKKTPLHKGKDGTAGQQKSAHGNRGDSGKRGGRLGRTQSDDDYEFEESESDVSSEEEVQEKRQETTELPAEYYQIQKLVKYLRIGNQTATIIAICSLRDFDLSNDFNQLAIRDVGGLETLINLLDTDDPKCKIGALKILKDISQNVAIRSAIADLGGMQALVDLLRDSDEDLKCLAAETIAHCAKNASNRRAVRRFGGIRKLVRLLKRTGSNEERVAISGALALATCSKSSRNKEAIQSAGAIPLLASLLESQNEKLLIPVVAILQECASSEQYRVAIRSSGMIKFLVENLSSNNEALQTHCASAIFKCAEEDETRDLVRQFGGLTPLVGLLDNVSNKELLVAATGAVWKCAQNLENVASLNRLNTIKKLVGLMENQPEDVLVNVVGALGACAQSADGRQAIREGGGITPLVNLLTGTNQSLLVNVTTAVGASALDSECMAIIDRLDGVRLLWSLLKSTNPHVQASAAWAISPCIEHAKDAGEMVRSFVGGLELIVSLLKSDNVEVLASVCAAIANIAKDEENLAVITDHGVVPMLAKLTNTRNDKLRKHLAEAIARCCHWGNNRVAFGTASAVAPLVRYLKSPDDEVHRSTARALHQLSMDPDNCITMHEHGVVQLLLGMVGSTDTALQEAAAGTIGNIRR
ncbi:armadillo-type protein [Cladochytrium replicatum]|nr:armadillo-type protein [Cladochytrium replicatum]